MLHAIYLMKFSLYLQAKMSGMSKCRHNVMPKSRYNVMTICRYDAIPKKEKSKKQKIWKSTALDITGLTHGCWQT